MILPRDSRAAPKPVTRNNSVRGAHVGDCGGCPAGHTALGKNGVVLRPAGERLRSDERLMEQASRRWPSLWDAGERLAGAFLVERVRRAARPD